MRDIDELLVRLVNCFSDFDVPPDHTEIIKAKAQLNQYVSKRVVEELKIVKDIPGKNVYILERIATLEATAQKGGDGR